MATYNITLKAWSDNAVLEPLTIYQNDILSRTINITLMDSNGPPIDLTDSAVRVYFVKDDKKIVYQEADIISETNGKISVTCESQVTAVPGPVVAMVQAIYNNGSTLNIGPLRLIVAANNLDNAIISTNDFSALTEALSTVQQYDGRIATNTAGIAELQIDKANKTEVIPLSQKGAPFGVATLDNNGNLVQELPSKIYDFNLTTNGAANYPIRLIKTGKRVEVCARVGWAEIGTFATNARLGSIPEEFWPINYNPAFVICGQGYFGSLIFSVTGEVVGINSGQTPIRVVGWLANGFYYTK